MKNRETYFMHMTNMLQKWTEIVDYSDDERKAEAYCVKFQIICLIMQELS